MNTCILKLAPTSEATFSQDGRLRICISAPVPDRDDEVVIPAKLRLDSYRKNPVLLVTHDQRRLPVGKCENLFLDEDGRLMAEVSFADTEEGQEVAKLYRDGILRGASIGFISDGTREVSPDEAYQRFGVRKRLREHVGGELLEISCVPIPSCPDALALEWIDASAAAAVVRGGACELVTKSLTPFLLRQATTTATTAQTAEVTVSQTTEPLLTPPTDPPTAVVTKATSEEEDRPEEDAPDDAPPADPPDDAPDEDEDEEEEDPAVTLRMAGHAGVDALFDADPDDTESHESAYKSIRDAHTSYVKYCKKLEDDEPGDDEDDEDDEENTDLEEKSADLERDALLGEILDQQAAEIADLKAEIAELKAFQAEVLKTFAVVTGVED
jgi:hypothetical protein